MDDTVQLYKKVDSYCVRLELCVNCISFELNMQEKESAMQGLLTVNIVAQSTRNKNEDLILSKI
jgi:hypothetical protein